MRTAEYTIRSRDDITGNEKWYFGGNIETRAVKTQMKIQSHIRIQIEPLQNPVNSESGSAVGKGRGLRGNRRKRAKRTLTPLAARRLPPHQPSSITTQPLLRYFHLGSAHHKEMMFSHFTSSISSRNLVLVHRSRGSALPGLK